MSKSRPHRALAGLALALALAPAVDAALGAALRARGPREDPVAMVWSERSVFLERVGMTLYVTAALAFALAWYARGGAERAGSAFVALCVASLALAVGGGLLPR